MIEKLTIHELKKGALEQDFKNLSSWLQTKGSHSKNICEDYIAFIKESNGGIFTYGNREYQFLSLNEIVEYYEIYKFSLYMPLALPFAMDGRGNFYLFDMRKESNNIYGVHSVNIGWREDECFIIANSFTEMLEQKILLDELH